MELKHLSDWKSIWICSILTVELSLHVEKKNLKWKTGLNENIEVSKGKEIFQGARSHHFHQQDMESPITRKCISSPEKN